MFIIPASPVSCLDAVRPVHPVDARPRRPALDVVESERGYTVNLEVPGVTKEDVKILIDGHRISVEAQSARTKQTKEGDRIVCRERAIRNHARSVTLPAEVNQAESGAKLENVGLTLTLPKRSARHGAALTVNCCLQAASAGARRRRLRG